MRTPIGLTLLTAVLPVVSCVSLDEYSTGPNRQGDAVAHDSVADTLDAAKPDGPSDTSPSEGSVTDVVFDGDNQDTDLPTDASDVSDTSDASDTMPPQCDDNTEPKCDGSVYQTCVDGKLQREDCAIKGLFCRVSDGGCTSRCVLNSDCPDNDKVDGQYCRGDARCSSKIFETVWNVSSGRLVLPYYDDDGKGKCDFRILWGDEAPDADITKAPHITDCSRYNNLTHRYESSGIYHVKIYGTYDGWGVPITPLSTDCSFAIFPPMLDMKQLRKVVHFGPVGLTQGGFCFTHNVEFPSNDIPDASKWTNATNMFWCSELFNEPLDNWDVSNVTTMTSMFELAAEFNQPLDTWNVANVTSMQFMFRNASAFDQDLSSWSLNPKVKLKEMFQKSGLSEDNYCELASLPVWEDSLSVLGITYECP